MMKKKNKKLFNDFQEEKEVIKIKEYVFNPQHKISDLANILKVSKFFLIKKFIDLGIKVNIDQNIDKETIKLFANHFDIKIIFEEQKKENKFVKKIEKKISKKDLNYVSKKEIIKRVPIVIIMGHVDHGKTTLLDSIRKKRTVEKEFGGITQHIGAYQIICNNGEKITFIDSPGHEAFFKMRLRGAQITDICLLIVAADDGVKAQTIESIKHAQMAKVEIIVVINKIDKPNIQKESIMSELSKFDLIPEKWGGKTIYVEISALKNEGIDELLSIILLMRDIKNIRTDLKKLPKGVVLESGLDKNKGPVATLISFQGILEIGDFIVIEDFFGKIRSIESDSGKNIRKAYPSQPILVSGLSQVPEAGDNFVICKDIKKAKNLSEERKKKFFMQKKIEEEFSNLVDENVFEAEDTKKDKLLNIILKTDHQGSIDAIIKSIENIKKNDDSIKIKFVKSSVGMITVNDIKLAQTFDAILIGFNIFISNEIKKMAHDFKLQIKNYNVLYEIIDDIENRFTEMEEPVFEDKLMGKAEVRQIFNISSIGVIAGCYVIQGEIYNNSFAKIIRDNKFITEDKIISLKHLKDNISQASQNHECGILLQKFNSFKLNDIIECYKKERVKIKK
ncbi:translation initiation factor IF-2 [Candidatus Phytoplasma sacchari]|nr:translation initiation factor IF-2 [Candidatus Phytoplasma sacchari]KAB8122141.1 translation initiation factor IF-2 [Candidatus Phytoplasma sacchari]